MVCLGWKVQTNPLSYAGTQSIICQTIFTTEKNELSLKVLNFVHRFTGQCGEVSQFFNHFVLKFWV